MKIQKASEDYLETMLMMQEKHGYIRSIDVAEQLRVTKPSVSWSALEKEVGVARYMHRNKKKGELECYRARP